MDAKELGNQPAANTYQFKVGEFGGYSTGSKGLTKRELFAAMAMQALISKSPYVHSDKDYLDKTCRIALGAAHYANALLAELAKAQET